MSGAVKAGPIKASIIVTAHNYAKFLPQSLESALGQNFAQPFEVVVVDDGSTDHTAEVLAHYADNPRLKVIRTEGLGLAAAANLGIRSSRGEYVVRLDADDWFDENLLLVLSGYLDTHPTIGLVFCDYYTVDVHGEIIQGVRRAKVNDEVELLDRPCLAAGAMYRRSCFDVVGGYDESLRYQEDYDFWIRFIEKYPVRNVSLPLMYYRQHGASMSRNWHGRMNARRAVKHRFVEANRAERALETLAVIPARATLMNGHKLALLPLGESDLLGRAIAKLRRVEQIGRIIVSTEDAEIAERAVALGAEVPFLRAKASAGPSVPFETPLKELLAYLRATEDYHPRVLALIHPHVPFINAAHVAEAIDTLLLYRTESVISVVEDSTYHWKAGRSGLIPVHYQERVVRQDKDLIFKEAGGFYVIDNHRFEATGRLLGDTVGHIELTPYESLRIHSPYEYWVAQNLLADRPPFFQGS